MEASSNPVVQRLLREGGQARTNHIWESIQAANTVLIDFHSRYTNNTLEIGSGEEPCYIFRPDNIPALATTGCTSAGVTTPIGGWQREAKYVLDKIRQIAGHFVVTKSGNNIFLHLRGSPWGSAQTKCKDKDEGTKVYAVVCSREANVAPNVHDDNNKLRVHQKGDKKSYAEVAHTEDAQQEPKKIAAGRRPTGTLPSVPSDVPRSKSGKPKGGKN